MIKRVYYKNNVLDKDLVIYQFPNGFILTHGNLNMYENPLQSNAVDDSFL